MQKKPSQDQINILINLYHSGKIEKVISTCRKLLKTYKNSFILFNILGAAFQEKGRLKEAINSYNQAIKFHPNHADSYYNRGIAFQKLGYSEKAISSYKQAIQFKSNYADAYHNLGTELYKIGELEDAIDSYNKTISINPNYVNAYSNRGNALMDLDELDEAIINYTKAIQLNPDYAEGYNNLGVALKEAGKIDEAIINFNKAIQLNPDYAEAYYNIGLYLKDSGRQNEAANSFNKAITIDPDYAEAHFNLSLVLLSFGDFSHGWEKYEYRKLMNESPSRNPKHSLHQTWNGEHLKSKKILITAEQGVGDEVMFASCIPDIINQHPKQVIIECDYRLVPLFKRSFTQVVVIEKKQRSKAGWLNKVGEIDFQIAIGSLPKFFRQEISDFPSKQPFLIPDNILRTKWKQRYNELGEGIKIGISWTGGRKGSTKKSAATTLEQWIPLFKKNAFFINLQYGEYSDDLRQLEESTGIHIYDWDDADPLTDLDNQAAQIAELDLVISFSNSTIHIAGSVGTPTWVLLTFVPDFRWILNRKDSPWYSSVKSFRQQQYGDWENVFSQVENELDMLIQ
jgi:tetratricopeptide (TPR) repeat protein